MSKPNEPKERGHAAVRTLALALLLPLSLSAWCGVASIDSPAPDTARPATADKPAGTYQIRCWQLGRLLFEENNVALPTDLARQGLKLSATDRHGRPIYLTDTANATCLIRSSISISSNPSSGPDDERPWPRETR
jgi:hypothetical protein